jgi:post-segregation antitoxin (ccd killing protein)
MSYTRIMNVDRLSVTVPAELGSELRRVCALRGEAVSAVVTEAIARELRLLALDDALRAADAEFGPVAESDIVRAMQLLVPTPHNA